MEIADSEGGGAGAGGCLGCSLPHVFLPCFHLLQIGKRVEITLELFRFILGKKGVDLSNFSDKT